MNILILANTPFQLIVAIQLVNTEFKNETVDLIISDNIAQYKLLVKRIQESAIFSDVCELKSKDQTWQSWKYTLFDKIYKHNITNRIPFLSQKRYDLYLFANIGGVAECIGTYLNKITHTKLAMYEDGFASYTDFYKKEIENAIHPHKFKSKLIYFFRKRALAYINYYYVFNPDLLNDWHFSFNIIKIKAISKNTLPLLNSAFNYKPTTIYQNYKYIFFEESYFADGKNVGDFEIIEKIADYIGKENLLIKLHPRNPINRFSKKGYNTNCDTSIPWEIIALNIDIKNKILITIASGSSITSYFISGQKASKSILLYEMDIINRTLLTPSLHIFDRICKHDQYFCYPRTITELRNIIKNK